MKNKSKKLIIILAALFVVASPICGVITNAYADNELPEGVSSTDINAIHNDLAEEAFAQLSWHILYKCVRGSQAERGNAIVPADVFSNEDFFDYLRYGFLAGVVTVPTGYYLEGKVQGGTDYEPDGAIYCKNNNNKILEVAAEALDIDYRIILCDGSSPGIIRNRNDTSECNPTSTDSKYEFNPNYESHLEKLWSEKQSEKGWSTNWSEIGEYGGVNGYILYSYEAGVRCGGTNESLLVESLSTDITGYKFEPPLHVVGQDGGVSYQYFEENNEIANLFVGENHDEGGAKFKSCQSMIERANSDTIKTEFRNRVLELFNERCENYYQSIIDDDSLKVSDEAKAEFESLKTQGGQSFLEEKEDENDPDDTEDMQCVEIDGLLHPEQADDQGYAADADQQVNNQEPSCYDRAGSLGWILCPLIDTMGDFILDKYETWVMPALQIDVKLFANNNETYESWKIFRDIANIVFVIFFIFVIFSQISGIGIDNYGIKKALPKLIACAILINLSYIISQAAIDLFNILGYGIANVFNDISERITINSIKIDGVSVSSSYWDSYFSNSAVNTVIVIVVGAVITGIVLTQGLAIIIPVLLLVLSIAFTIFSLIAILAIRQALAVILVVISPVAFVFYMLPNTKPLFDKWFNTFKGVLVAFPICSLAVYGGNLVGKILLNSAGDNTWLVISAAIISVAPVFIIPKLITKSVGAIGALTAGYIMGKLGSKADTAARGRLEHSALTRRRDYNRMSREQAHQARTGEYNYRKAQKALNGRFFGLNKRNVADMSAAQRAKYHAAQGMIDAENHRRQDMYTQSFSTLSPDAINSQVDSMLKSGKFDANMATAAIESLGGADQGEMLQTLTKMSSSASWEKMSNDDRSRIADSLLAQKDNAVAQSYGKILKKSGQNVSFNEALTGSQRLGDDNIAKRLGEMDAGVLANQDKDTLNYIAKTTYKDSNGDEQYLADAFTSEQIGRAISESDGYSKKSVELQSVLAQRQDLSDDIYHMTDVQMAGTKNETLEGAMKKRFASNGRKNITDSETIMKSTVKTKVKSVQGDDNLKGNLDIGFMSGSFK